MSQKWNLPRGYLSPSSITRYLSCPACWALEYVEKVPKPVSVNLPLGGAVHRAVESMRRHLIACEDDLRAADFAEVALDHFTGDGLGFDRESEVEVQLDLGKYESLDKAKDHLVQLVQYSVPELAKLDMQRHLMAAEVMVCSDEKLLREDEKELDRLSCEAVAVAYPFPFKGRLDALYGKDAPSLLSDLKTSSKQGAPDNNAALQMSLYNRPFAVSGQPLGVLVDVLAKTAKPSLRTYAMSASDIEQDAVYALVVDVAEKISAGDFPPRPGFLCAYTHCLPAFSVAIEGYEAA